MLPVIEKLLILQDRDRKLMGVQDELARLEPERQDLKAKLTGSQADLDGAKHKVRQLESERKKLELEVEARKSLIEKYSLQQFQTKKNEEYRALAHEIETCKEQIQKLDDQQLEFMEQMEAAQKIVASASQTATEGKKVIDARLGDIATREANLREELAGLQSNRSELAAAVDDSTRSRYDRLLKQKGQSVIVGIQHGVCGGCHMGLSRSVVLTCQADLEIIPCPNCGRILYYTSDMDLAVSD